VGDNVSIARRNLHVNGALTSEDFGSLRLFIVENDVRSETLHVLELVFRACTGDDLETLFLCDLDDDTAMIL
jgi:hypothetical protein